MKTIKKNIQVVEMVEKLTELDKTLNDLPPLLADRISFKITIESIGDLISLGDQYDVTVWEPSTSLMFHWCVIYIGENVSLHLETKKELYKITY